MKKTIPKRFIGSVWLFPVLLLIPLVLLTAFRINGSSIGGTYHEIFYGTTEDPDLLMNRAQSIRSDEWIVNTQLTIAQRVAGYPLTNPNIDSGRDMSIVGDVPYKEWSVIFRPQNLAFFVLPFENAFAFKWWLILLLPIVGCYFFVLRLFPGKRLLAATLGTAVGCSPFLLWWYSIGPLATVFYGFFILLISIRIINNERLGFLGQRLDHYSQLFYALALAYLLTAFALILYPPFQIPIAIVVAAFITGLFLEKFGLGQRLLSRAALGRLAVFAISIVLCMSVVFTFLQTRAEAVSAITNTVYPGNRITKSGEAPLHELFTIYMQPQLQRLHRAAHYYTNQSEASQFILLLPFLFLPGFVLLAAEYKARRRINWPLLMLQLTAALFLLNLTVSVLQPVYDLFRLDKVPAARLFIGLGFLGVLQLLLIIKSVQGLRINPLRLSLWAGAYVLVCAGIMIWAGLYTREEFPQFIQSLSLIGAGVLYFSVMLFLFLTRRALLGSLMLLAFTVFSIHTIHPLYRGLGPYYEGRLSQAIQTNSKPGDSWVALDNILFENAALISNRDSLSGVKPYPDLKFWSQVSGRQDERIYNRYAHVVFNSSDDFTDKIRLINFDTFQVQFACTPFIEKNVDYAFAAHPLDETCVRKIDEVKYPKLTFYIYKVY